MPLNSIDPTLVVGLLIGLSLAPFVAMMVSSYVKIVVVLSLIRNALGVQSIPPNMVINGLALILSVFVMTPVIEDMFDAVQGRNVKLDDKAGLLATAADVKEPLKKFLLKHAPTTERRFFLEAATRLWPPERASNLQDDDLIVLVPAFTVHELTTAFEIGFLIYLPFIVVDLVVSNILLAMGMQMISPTTVSLPFKLLLFVLVDGWTRLIHGLVLSYA